jgi:exonuclease SbcC
MLITRVELENIKNYEHSSFELEPGITAICGPNGAGKTTILEAISWSLFDYIPYKKEDFLRRGTKKGWVAVTFISSVDDREYTVYRDTTNGYYVYDPVTRLRLVEQKNQVAAWIKQHLGVDPGTDLKSLFVSAIGVPQGTFTADFSEQAARRKIGFDRVLRVEDYQRSAEELRSLIHYIETRTAGMREEIARVEVQVSVLDELLSKRAKLETGIQRLVQELPEAERERESVKAELERLEALKRNIERLTHDLQSLNVRIEEGRVREAAVAGEVEVSRLAVDLVAAAEPGFQTFNRANVELRELEGRVTEREKIRRDLATLERQLVTEQNVIQNLAEKVKTVESNRKEMVKLEPLVKEQQRLETLRSALQTSAGEMSALKRQESATDQELTSLRNEYKELSKQVEEAEELKSLCDRWPSLEQERKAIESRLRESRIEFERMGTLRLDLDRLLASGSKLVAEVESLEQGISASLSVEQVVSRIPDLEARDRKAMEEIARVRAAIDYDRKTLDEIKDGLCPLLSQRCLNMKDGQGLDRYFLSQMDSGKDRLATLVGEHNEIQKQLDASRSALRAYSALEGLRAQQDRCREDLEARNQEASRVQEELGRCTATDQAIKQMAAGLELAEEQLKAAQTARAKYESLGPIRQRIKRLENDGAAKRKLLEELKRQLESMRGIESELGEVDEKIKELQDPRGRSRALQQSVRDEKQIRNELDHSRARERDLSVEARGLEGNLQTFASLDEQIIELREGRAVAEKDYLAYIENQPVAAMLPSRVSELESLRQSLVQNLARVEELSSALVSARSSYNESTHSDIRLSLEQAVSRASALAFELAAAQERLQTLGREIEGLMDARRKLASLIDEKERSETLLSTSDLIRDVLKKAGPYITEAHLQTISIEANQLYRDITGNPMVTLRWDPGYEIVLEEDGHDRPFASLSGGEQMVAALAVRLALLKELSDMRIAFFDEPTTNMDEERRNNLASQLGRIRDFDQLFVISHDDTFEGYTDRVITLKASGSGASV